MERNVDRTFMNKYCVSWRPVLKIQHSRYRGCSGGLVTITNAFPCTSELVCGGIPLQRSWHFFVWLSGHSRLTVSVLQTIYIRSVLPSDIKASVPYTTDIFATNFSKAFVLTGNIPAN